MIGVRTAERLFAQLLWPVFVEVDGCVFLPGAAPKAVELTPNILPDRTAVESFYNHIHVLDLFRHSASLGAEPWWDAEHPDFAMGCRLGKSIAEMWRWRLQQLFPGRAFRIYYAPHDNPTVRFHSVHAGEPPWVDDSDATSMDVLVLETTSGPPGP